ncbi:MAG TPA: hypothetical protein VGU20_15190 [Stellaceae bacterium]|nr:hypothetical protein [Stellaceae bacterium]
MSGNEANIAALTAEAHHWAARRSSDPYDRGARENLARVLFAMQRDRFPLGTVERGQHLLSIIGDTFPLAPLRAAYFENLERLLAGRPRRASPGSVVLGLGSGRCGSTSLTALVGSAAGSIATHENPPLVYWEPLAEQRDFHFERLARLAGHFALVFDVSHWWLNLAESFLARFPDGKIVGLHRELEACARSFLARKALGRGSINHWAPPNNGIWRHNIWDPAYPTFPLPPGAASDPDGVKLEAIRRYVREYNEALRALADHWPARVFLLRTEELGEAAAQHRLFAFLGVAGKPAAMALNAGTVADGTHQYWF